MEIEPNVQAIACATCGEQWQVLVELEDGSQEFDGEATYAVMAEAVSRCPRRGCPHKPRES